METKIRSYKDLLVWQKAVALAKLVYKLAQNFLSEEKFGLVAKMRRAAVSIQSNIAEGQARYTTGELIAELRSMLNAFRRKLAARE
jgi:four helix bundle protein